MIKTCRDWLPEEGKILFDDIQTGKVLGAGNHIRMIGQILKLIAGSGALQSDEIKERVLAVSRYYKETRGKSSYAIVSALSLMTRGLEQAEPEEVPLRLAQNVDAYFSEAAEDAQRITETALRLAAGMDTLMVFDYSSTVERFIAALRGPRIVYVPESRAIDGGKPFLASFVGAGHRVRFIPDAAMLTVLDRCKGVFIGAETFYPDGTAFNTVGSDILAELCAARRIPFYVLTPLIKLDMRAAEGIFKEPVKGDLREKLGAPLGDELREKIDFECTELVGIPPAFITAFVTEEGIVPTPALFAVSGAYNDRINRI